MRIKARSGGTAERRVVAVVVALLLLAGCGARQVTHEVPVARPPAPAPPVAECSAGGVAFSVLGDDAAMGIRVLTIEMLNCGTRPYTVEGYPGVRLFDEEREPVEVVVEQGSGTIATMPDYDVPPAAVVLLPGEKARAGLLWRNLVTDATVAATTAVHLEARPGAGRPWQPVPLTTPDQVDGTRRVTIDLGNTGRLGVSPWTKA